MSVDRISDVRYPSGWNVSGQDSGCEISGWMECQRTGFRMCDIRVDGMSANRIPDVRYLGGWNVGGLDSGCDISGWNEL